MSLQHNKPKNTSKHGFEAFGCHIPQSIISHAKAYINANKEWDSSVFPLELYYTTINAVAWDRVEHLPTRDKNGQVLASSFEKLLEHMMRTDQITLSESMMYTGLLQKLGSQGTPKNKKRAVEVGGRRSSTPIKKRQRSLTPVYDHESDDELPEINKSFDYEKEKSPTKAMSEGYDDDDNSEYDFENDGQDEMNEHEKNDMGITPLPPTPTYQNTPRNVRKVDKSVSEKKAPVVSIEDSDSDSFDPVNDEDIGVYDPLGEILPSTRRVVVKGANKSYYGENYKIHLNLN